MKKRYLIKFEKRILYLFLSWEIFYIPLLIRNNYSLFKNGGVNINTISKFIFDFLYPIPSNGNGWGSSWYLIAMMIGLPIFIYIYKSFNIYVIAFISVILESYYVAATGYGYLTHLSTLGTYSFPRIFIYIFLGLLIAKYIDRINMHSLKFYLVISVLLLILFLIENYLIKKSGGVSNGEEIITTAPTSLCITLLGLKWNPLIQNFITIRHYSTFLYCAQCWPIALLPYILKLNGIINVVVSFIFILISVFLAFELYRLIKVKTKWKFWNYMV